jgi:hypothetical protein
LDSTSPPFTPFFDLDIIVAPLRIQISSSALLSLLSAARVASYIDAPPPNVVEAKLAHGVIIPPLLSDMAVHATLLGVATTLDFDLATPPLSATLSVARVDVFATGAYERPRELGGSGDADGVAGATLGVAIVVGDVGFDLEGGGLCKPVVILEQSSIKLEVARAPTLALDINQLSIMMEVGSLHVEANRPLADVASSHAVLLLDRSAGAIAAADALTWHPPPLVDVRPPPFPFNLSLKLAAVSILTDMSPPLGPPSIHVFALEGVTVVAAKDATPPMLVQGATLHGKGFISPIALKHFILLFFDYQHEQKLNKFLFLVTINIIKKYACVVRNRNIKRCLC